MVNPFCTIKIDGDIEKSDQMLFYVITLKLFKCLISPSIFNTHRRQATNFYGTLFVISQPSEIVDDFKVLYSHVYLDTL